MMGRAEPHNPRETHTVTIYVYERTGGAGHAFDAITAPNALAALRRFDRHPNATFRLILATDEWTQASAELEKCRRAAGLPHPPVAEAGTYRGDRDCDRCLYDRHHCPVCIDVVGCGHLHDDIDEPLDDDADLATV